jgi:hypothetical protein
MAKKQVTRLPSEYHCLYSDQTLDEDAREVCQRGGYGLILLTGQYLNIKVGEESRNYVEPLKRKTILE